MSYIRIITRSPEETEDIGFKLGTFLKASATPGTILLYGDLGAGKTTLIKGIASAFGIAKRDLGSASFVMVAEYETAPPFYHIDLYRVDKQADMEALGIWEYINSDGIAVVEWAERLSDVPEEAIKVKINYADKDAREIIIEGIDEESWDNL